MALIVRPLTLPAGSLTARSRSGGGIKWTISLTSWLPWSPPASPWLENLTNSLCYERPCHTWKPSKVTLDLYIQNASNVYSAPSQIACLLVYLAGTSSAFTDTTYKPSILPHDDLRQLLLRVGVSVRSHMLRFDCTSMCLLTLSVCLSVYQAADGFLLVVSCDRAKILFTSESVSKILHFSRVCCTSTPHNYFVAIEMNIKIDS